MQDYVWFIVIGVLFALIGILFAVLGWQIWKKQRMDLIIQYHCSKVQEADKRSFCALSGLGILVIGIGFLLSGLCTVFLRSALVFVPMTVGLIAGIILLASAIGKYNR